jgi:hypothetical protein
VIALGTAVLLAILANLGFGMASAPGGAGHDVKTAVAMGSGLITVGNTRHSDHGCRHDKKAADCSPCPSCSGGLPSGPGGDSEIMTIVRTPVFRSHYDDVVPVGIRRPPKLS